MTDVVTDSAASAEAPETVATYLRLRGLKPSAKNWKRKRRISVDDDNAPFTPGRDPEHTLLFIVSLLGAKHNDG